MKGMNTTMTKKNFFKMILYGVGLYICWEATAILLQIVIEPLWPELTNPIINQYLSMTITELLVFALWWLIFNKRLASSTEKSPLKFLIITLLPVYLQVFQDFYLLNTNKQYYAFFSKEGLIIFLFCLMGAISIALCEEFFWRRILLNTMLQSLGTSKYGVIAAISLSSILFGLCHYMNILTGGQTFADTTQQVIAATCSGLFFATVYYRSGTLIVPIAIHGFCNYTNFIMNEFLNYTYTPPLLFSAFDYIIPLLYVLCSIVVLLRSDQFTQLP